MKYFDMASKVYKRQRKKSTYVSKGTGWTNPKFKRTYIDKVKNKLYSDTRETINMVNKRLRNLEKGGYKGTWASRKLFARLDTKDLLNIKRDKRGERIVLKKGITNTQLRLINKASKQFLASETSTIRGINKVRDETLDSLRRTLGVDNTKFKNISERDVEYYYNMLDDKDVRSFADKGKASVVWSLVADYREILDSRLSDSNDGFKINYETKDEFVDIMGKHLNVELDDDMRDTLSRIYENYVL